jgi:hypothetical protein
VGQPAPLWEPAGAEVSCQVLIDSIGKIGELEAGKQLYEPVPCAEFSYKPTVERGKVRTDMEIRFEPITKPSV